MYEAHEKYIDVHYIMEGAERIATADVSSLQIMTPFSEERDIGFYQGDESGRYLLKPGEFMVCFPSDAHKVAMMDKTPETVDVYKRQASVFSIPPRMPVRIFRVR